MNNEDDILNLREASECFQIGVHTLYRLAKTGKVPAKKIEYAWRFEKQALCIWISDSPFNRRICKDRRQCDDNIMSSDRRCGKDRRKQIGDFHGQ